MVTDCVVDQHWNWNNHQLFNFNKIPSNNKQFNSHRLVSRYIRIYIYGLCQESCLLINSKTLLSGVRFAVGVHKNKAKFARQFDFNRPPGKIYQRGWKVRRGLVCDFYCRQLWLQIMSKKLTTEEIYLSLPKSN